MSKYPLSPVFDGDSPVGLFLRAENPGGRAWPEKLETSKPGGLTPKLLVVRSGSGKARGWDSVRLPMWPQSRWRRFPGGGVRAAREEK